MGSRSHSFRLRCVNMALLASRMHPISSLILVKYEAHGNELILIVNAASFGRNDDARGPNFQLDTISLGYGINSEEISTLLGLKNSFELSAESGRREDCWRLFGYDREFHGRNPAARSHPCCWNDFVAERDNVIHILLIHQMGGSVNFDDSASSVNVVVTVLEKQRELAMNVVFEKYVAEGTTDEVVYEVGLARYVCFV